MTDVLSIEPCLIKQPDGSYTPQLRLLQDGEWTFLEIKEANAMSAALARNATVAIAMAETMRTGSPEEKSLLLASGGRA